MQVFGARYFANLTFRLLCTNGEDRGLFKSWSRGRSHEDANLVY